MDILEMLVNAKVNDLNGFHIGDVFGIHVVAGKLIVSLDVNIEGDEDDGDDGEKENIPEPQENKDLTVKGFPNFRQSVIEQTNVRNIKS